MAHDSHNNQHVRRIVLPSGKAIDVVYFDEAARPTALPLIDGDLHVCDACGSHLVYPLEWEEAGPRHWEVTLRCPDCETIGVGVFDQDDGRALRRGPRRGHRRARRRPQAPHADQHGGRGRPLRPALEAGHIVPEDF